MSLIHLHPVWILSKQVRKGQIFHCIMMATIFFLEAIMLPTSECHLGIREKMTEEAMSHGELGERGYGGLTPPHTLLYKPMMLNLLRYVTWQRVNNDSKAQNAVITEVW